MARARAFVPSHTSAKQLVPVANRPILEYGLEAIADVGIIVGETAPEIQAHVGNGSRFGLDVTFVHQPQPLGLAHAVLTAADYLGDDDFVMYLGDNLVAGGITEFVEQFRRRRPAAGADVTVHPIDTATFGAAAPRPAFSALDGRATALAGVDPLPPWQHSLRTLLVGHSGS